jgi:hypothetical protein
VPKSPSGLVRGALAGCRRNLEDNVKAHHRLMLLSAAALTSLGLAAAPGTTSAGAANGLAQPPSPPAARLAAQPPRGPNNACGFSQVQTPTRFNGTGAWLYPCDGVYINCWWNWDPGTLFLMDWVSWTSRYAYGQKGWVYDSAINTNNSTTTHWPRCPGPSGPSSSTP